MIDNLQLDFDAIHAEYREKICRFLTSMVGGLEAEDLTQEVFIRVNRGLPAFRGEAGLSTWVYKIATNLAIDAMRKSQSSQAVVRQTEPLSLERESELEDMDWTGEKPPALESQVVRIEMNQCILNYINQLPEIYRTVLALIDLEGLNYSQVAEILGISLEAMKMRLHRARQQIKHLLQTNCESYWVEGNEFVPELRRSKP